MWRDLIGNKIWNKYKRWPVYSKFFDNMGPIPHHMHQSAEASETGRTGGQARVYYFPPQHNNVGNNFPYTFFGLEPGTTKEQVRKCLENWNKGDNGILDLSKANRLKPGTGWLVGPCILHAPGSLCTYEPQWGSDFRYVPDRWSKAVTCHGSAREGHAQDKHQDLDFIVDQLDWEATSIRTSKTITTSSQFPLQIRARRLRGSLDRLYGSDRAKAASNSSPAKGTDGRSRRSAPSRTLALTASFASRAAVRSTVSRSTSPKLIRFHELTEDDTSARKTARSTGVKFENTQHNRAPSDPALFRSRGQPRRARDREPTSKPTGRWGQAPSRI